MKIEIEFLELLARENCKCAPTGPLCQACEATHTLNTVAKDLDHAVTRLKERTGWKSS